MDLNPANQFDAVHGIEDENKWDEAHAHQICRSVSHLTPHLLCTGLPGGPTPLPLHYFDRQHPCARSPQRLHTPPRREDGRIRPLTLPVPKSMARGSTVDPGGERIAPEGNQISYLSAPWPQRGSCITAKFPSKRLGLVLHRCTTHPAGQLCRT